VTIFSKNGKLHSQPAVRGQLFLDFEDEKEHIIKPMYAKEGSWFLYIGFTNSLSQKSDY